MRAAADRLHRLRQAAVIEVGRELLAIKNRIEHGHFVEWVERECQMQVRTAQRATQAAEMVARNDKLSYLPADGLTALASRAAAPVVDGIMERIEAGERPNAQAIKAEIKKARAEAVEAKLPTRQRNTCRKRREEDEARQREWERSEAARESRATANAEAAVDLLIELAGDRAADVMAVLEKTELWRVRGAWRKRFPPAIDTSAVSAAERARSRPRIALGANVASDSDSPSDPATATVDLAVGAPAP